MVSGQHDWTWPGGEGLITAKSKVTAQANVLNNIFSIIGPSNYRYNRASGELKLFGKPFRVIGASDESSWESILGATVGLWLADEVVVYPKSFFDMAMSRMSLVGSKAYATTNPGNPYHYLKREYIDDLDKQRCGDFWYANYSFEDNPNLAQSVRERLRRTYTGIFYRRYILGDWCMAEGAIYRDSISEANYYDDETRPVALLSHRGHREHWIAIDVGTMNPQVYLDIYDDGHTIWWEREYYWDGRERNLQKTDKEYADDLILGNRMLGWPGFPADRRLWPGVIVDPSAASFKTELMARGVVVIDADNEVDNGIRKVAALLNQRRIRIHKNNCPNAVRELQTYAWDPKKAEGGKEVPIKSHDHCPDAGRYHVNTRVGDWRIAA